LKQCHFEVHIHFVCTILFVSSGLAAFGKQFVNQRGARGALLDVLADEPLSPRELASFAGIAQAHFLGTVLDLFFADRYSVL